MSFRGFNTATYTFMIKWLPHNMIEFSEQHSFHFALNSNITFLYCSGIVIILCFRVDLFCFYHTCKKGGSWTGASLLVSGRGWNEGLLVHKGLLLTCESCKATIKDSENKHEQDGSTLRTLLYTRLVTVLPSCGTDGTSVWRCDYFFINWQFVHCRIIFLLSPDAGSCGNQTFLISFIFFCFRDQFLVQCSLPSLAVQLLRS